MTDFSSSLAQPANNTPATVDTLNSLRDDAELIAEVTLTLYPSWVASEAGTPDDELGNGRATWHGIIDELTGAR